MQVSHTRSFDGAGVGFGVLQPPANGDFGGFENRAISFRESPGLLDDTGVGVMDC